LRIVILNTNHYVTDSPAVYSRRVNHGQYTEGVVRRFGISFCALQSGVHREYDHRLIGGTTNGLSCIGDVSEQVP
jgi:hypothetical protein